MEQWEQMKINGELWNYEVSTHGRIRNMKRQTLLSPSENGKGYLQVNLSKNNRKTNFLIHRLVALTFIPNDNPQDKTQVNHKDEDKHNNHVDNLEWITPKNNINYGTGKQRSAKARTKKSGYH